ncbi:MAG: MotA/TolQ/ExbB proton channel family protein, partial [Eubacteriales bacterium]|nr:MotA/TolQ/ExbB proton channel family protein [Eubacteriales bacterium]
LGTTFAVMIASFPLQQLKLLPKVVAKAFTVEKHDADADIETIVALNEVVKAKGLLALESVSHLYENDSFLKRGVLLMLDGANEDQLRDSLNDDTYFMSQRHKRGSAMMDMLVATAPSLGLLCTYVGLIPMLTSLDNPTTLGPMMAIELVSSFYGGFLANVIFGPISKRLKLLHNEEVGRRELLLEGLIGIWLRKNPRLIREMMISLTRTHDAKSKPGKQPKARAEARKAA